MIFPSVLGRLLTEVKSNGTKKRTFVYGMNGVVALQTVDSANTQEVRWEHTDPGKATYLQTGYNGLVHSNSQAELDPLGSNVGLQAPQTEQMIGGGGWGYGTWGDAFGSYGCRVDGFDAPRSLCAQHLANGSGVPNNNHIQPMFLGHWMPDNREGRKDYFVPLSGLYSQQTQNSLNQPALENSAKPNLDNCLKKAGLTAFRDILLQKLSSGQTALTMILGVSASEGISAALLTFTWQNEGEDMSLFAHANSNGSEDPNDWDVGPFQLNTYYVGIDALAGDYTITDIAGEGGKLLYGSLKDPNAPFDGDPRVNARVAARKLKASGSSNRERAWRYTGLANKAGRLKNFDEWFPKWDKFFDCYRLPVIIVKPKKN